MNVGGVDEACKSNVKVFGRVKWRTGEQHVIKVPSRREQLRETGANARWSDPIACLDQQMGGILRDRLLGELIAAHQLVGRVTAYQGDDGQPAQEGGRPHWD
eukprot:TRINITY_DN586_c0_g2_i1.p4 TRINITY_DN586_c0_g2~~TRINITY_DN586_c0_g2_i1.p4  ORF type:complete len:102 (-),score=5.71 TRINITY_DN586_c0_g2_i1:539-844(-)